MDKNAKKKQQKRLKRKVRNKEKLLHPAKRRQIRDYVNVPPQLAMALWANSLNKKS
jgi:hypothetical protein